MVESIALASSECVMGSRQAVEYVLLNFRIVHQSHALCCCCDMLCDFFPALFLLQSPRVKNAPEEVCMSAQLSL